MSGQGIILVFFALAMPAIVNAQVQEKKLMDRINSPNRNQASQFQNKSFGSTGTSWVKSASFSSATYQGVKDAQIKSYAEVKSFLGVKNPWLGKKVYETGSSAYQSRGGVFDKDSAFRVKSAKTSTFSQSSKTASTPSAAVPTRAFGLKGAAQGALDQDSKIHKQMTIDEVRELLNKSR